MDEHLDGPRLAPPRRVTSLLGRRQVPMALTCLGSLIRRSAEPVGLVLHDDGTLAAEDRERLVAELGPLEIVGRAEADDRMADRLAGRPALERYRRTHPLALKLLDAPLLAAGPRLAFVDADVLFLRPFRGLFAATATDPARFMADRASAYSVRSWQVAAERRLRLRARINTGLLDVPRELVDLDLLEWFVGRPEHHRTPPWVEQTAWALLAARAPARLVDPRRVRLARPDEDPGELGPELVALHFVGPVRDRLEPVAAAVRTLDDGAGPVALSTVPAAAAGPLHLLGTELSRRIRRLTGSQRASSRQAVVSSRSRTKR